MSVLSYRVSNRFTIRLEEEEVVVVVVVVVALGEEEVPENARETPAVTS